MSLFGRGKHSAAWTSLGQTPLRMSGWRRPYVLRIAKPGYAPWNLSTGLSRGGLVLHNRRAPSRRYGPGGAIRRSPGRSARCRQDARRLPDRPHEVTNEEYKTFVDAGGYRGASSGSSRSSGDGEAVPWEEAVARLPRRDGSPRPGDVGGGQLSEGPREAPGRRRELVRGRRLRTRSPGRAFPPSTTGSGPPQTSRAERCSSCTGSNFRGRRRRARREAGGRCQRVRHDGHGRQRQGVVLERERGGRRFILGGGFGETTYMFIDRTRNRRGTGGRTSASAASSSPRRLPRPRRENRDRLTGTTGRRSRSPTRSSAAYKGLYAYDKGDLDAKVEADGDDADDWTQEKVSFNAAYGGERVVAHLFLPKNGSAPLPDGRLFPGLGRHPRGQVQPSRLRRLHSEERPGPDVLRSTRAPSSGGTS